MRDPVLAGNDGKRNGVVIYDINSSASWEDLGPAVKLLKIEDMEFRSYEFSIARTIYKGENTLAIVPTGKGKTILELLAAAKAISDGKRAIFVAATKPLAQQHYNEAISRFRDTEGIDMLVGTVDRKKRDDICKNSKLIIGTPEKVVNEILSGRIKLEDFGVGIIDETQRTRGEYAYSKLADLLNEKHIQIVSLTGSLSSQKSMAGAIISRLNIENVEVRDWKDKDIAPYMRKVDVKRIYVEKSPEMLEIDKAFKKLIKTNIDAMMKAGLLEDSSFNFGALADQQPEVAIDFEKMSRRKFLALQKDVDSLGDEVSAMISKANEDRSMGRMADSNLQEDIRTKIKGMKSFTKLKYIFHAYDTFQTQGFAPTLDYIEKLDSNYRNRKNKQYRSKGLAELLYGREDEQYGVHMREGTMHEVFDPIAKAVSLGQEHPKVEALMNIVRENPKE
ncbi:MAG: DEAD/DEAH box helicase, partial [Candidatus Micrarchaeaceae archaeon]